MSLREPERRLLEMPVPEMVPGDAIGAISRIRPIGPMASVKHPAQTESRTCTVQTEVIGHSREGRPLQAFAVGGGPQAVSVIAGCHADEPVGPLTAFVLPEVLAAYFPEFLERFRFHVIPQMNPDGAERNRAWFGESLSFAEYARNVVREKPGDDVEFGFGEGDDARPECRAAMAYLQGHAPYCAHFSLHGMGFSEGAWFLLCREWVDKAEPLMDAVERVVASVPFPLHDIDREGEKGFWRIGPGFCTTPTSTAMREYFLQQGDLETADKFKPSSMEFVRSLGGDPLCMVSEMPLFRIGRRDKSEPGAAYERFKKELDRLRAQGACPDKARLNGLAERYSVTCVPIAVQVRLQIAMIVLALENVDGAG